MKRSSLLQPIICALFAVNCAISFADTFGSGANTFEIEFLTIGKPGNPADAVVPQPTSAPLPSGTVDYTYRMAKYEISEEIIAMANSLSDAGGKPLNLMVDVERGPRKPATGLSWFDAARFVNWLNEDQGAPAAYKFDDQNQFQLWEPGDVGYNPDNPFRIIGARYFLPSADEWHKAAYFDPVNDRYWLYPYGSDDPPIAVASGTDPGTAVYNQSGPADVQLAGGENLFGLVGMAGNVYDFEESSIDLANNDPLARRGSNGSAWIFDLTSSLSSSFRNSGLPHASRSIAGIRVASIPEPSTLLLTLVSGALILHVRKRQFCRQDKGSGVKKQRLPTPNLAKAGMGKDSLSILAAVCLLFCSRVEAAPFTVRTLALSGTDGGLGPSLDSGDVFGGFREPLINSDGVVSFPADLSLVDGTEHEGLWVNSGSANSPIAVTGRAGILGPNLSEGVVFDRLWNSLISDNGSVASLAYVRGEGVLEENRAVTFVNDGTGNRVIARTGVSGQLGPGVDGAVYQFLQAFRISPTGVVLQTATLTGPAINENNHTGIWIHSDRGRNLIFQTGQRGLLGAGLGPDSFFVDDSDSYPPQFVAETGEVILYAFAKRSEAAPQDTGLWRNVGGANTPLMLSGNFGDLGPGLGPTISFIGHEGDGFTNFPDIKFDANASGDVLFSADLTDGRSGFWTNYGDRNRIIAVTDETGLLGPELNDGSVFTDLTTNFSAAPMITDTQVALFKAVVSDGVQSRIGLFINDGSGNRPIALTGIDSNLGPDEGSGDIFTGFNRAAMNSEGTVFFTANATPNVPRNRLIGLWAYNDGELTQLAKVGVPFDVGVSGSIDLRIPRYVQMAYEQQVDSNGAVVNDRGEVIFYMGFEDGSYGIFTARVVLEPTSLVSILAGFICSLQWHPKK